MSTLGNAPLSVAVGDFNNDGKQDIAAANFNANTVSIRLGDGLGGFSGTTDVGVGDESFIGAIGDFNNDGNQDIATANLADKHGLDPPRRRAWAPLAARPDVGVGDGPF